MATSKPLLGDDLEDPVDKDDKSLFVAVCTVCMAIPALIGS
jgi:hypothetical protein